MLTADKAAAELAYLDRAHSGGFERPYGWAWLLALHREAQRHEDRPWAAALLELKDRNGVIKAQVGTALPLLLVNTLLIYFLAFR